MHRSMLPNAVITCASGENSDVGSLPAIDLSLLLLRWWQQHGRLEVSQKPWMFMADGSWPSQAEALSPYGIWIAEVMRCSAA